MLKLVPVIVTVVPAFALAGVKYEIVGPATNVNPDKVAVPPGVVTLTLPLVPAATTAVICVALFTANEVAAVPPKLTAVALLKAVPVITTENPLPVLVGVKEVITGTSLASINKVLLKVPLY